MENDGACLRASMATKRRHIPVPNQRTSWRFLEFFTVNIRNKNTRAVCASCRRFSALVCRAGDRRARPGATRPRGRLYRGAAGGAVGADGQATSRGDPDAFRLAGNRPGDAIESGACRSRAALFGEQGVRRAAGGGRLRPHGRIGRWAVREPGGAGYSARWDRSGTPSAGWGRAVAGAASTARAGRRPAYGSVFPLATSATPRYSRSKLSLARCGWRTFTPHSSSDS